MVSIPVASSTKFLSYFLLTNPLAHFLVRKYYFLSYILVEYFHNFPYGVL
ncbi:hypothetical protein FOPG_17018 [Acetobacter orientalis]|uniref:Uncharacterized protein n=1 Tax=Acetobacter orientalis TaxID=146474 RepID=A0A2Z5ZLH9_9PROT|nr:hypothetical protein FOPG_17018 [Acetobacter orientalis]